MVAQFHSWKAFLNMGGYGFYVWTSYGALVCMLVLGAWTPLRQLKALKKSRREDFSPTSKYMA